MSISSEHIYPYLNDRQKTTLMHAAPELLPELILTYINGLAREGQIDRSVLDAIHRKTFGPPTTKNQ